MRRIFLTALALIFAAGTTLAQDKRVITTTGVGTVEAPSDMATIRLGVTHQDTEAAAAMEATSEGVHAIIDRLMAAGIDADDIQTDQLSLQPIWTNYNAESRRITGFMASNILSLRVRDLSVLGEVLDLVIRDGANAFNGLSFGLQDPKPAQDAARAAAVADAIDRAQQLAQAAGVTLGPIQSISEAGSSPRPQMMEMTTARMASDVPIAAGELSVTAQVNIVFGIAD